MGNSKKDIKVEYTDDDGTKQEFYVSLEELCVLIENWANKEQKLPKNLKIVPTPSK